MSKVPYREDSKSQGPVAAVNFGYLRHRVGQGAWSRVGEGRVDGVMRGRDVPSLWAFGFHSRAMDGARRSGAGE